MKNNSTIEEEALSDEYHEELIHDRRVRRGEGWKNPTEKCYTSDELLGIKYCFEMESKIDTMLHEDEILKDYPEDFERMHKAKQIWLDKLHAKAKSMGLDDWGNEVDPLVQDSLWHRNTCITRNKALSDSMATIDADGEVTYE